MSRFSLTHRLALLGVALLLVTGAGIATILEGFGGRFATYDVVYADIPASGTGIATGSVVLFRDITVGTVATLGRELPNGLLRVTLHLDPSDLHAIPSGVRADVEIATVFGTQGINLVPPGQHPLRLAHLARSNQIVSSVARSKTTTLQGDATDLDNLLNALHPAALDQTLSAIATALRDQGPSLGSTINQVATYLHQMVPQLPGVENDITALGPVSHDLATAAPPLLSTLANGAVTAATINAQATQLRQLLAGAAPTADELTTFVARTQAAYEDLVANSAPLLADIAANPDEIAQTLSGFDSWSKAFATAESQGPYLSFSGDIAVSGSVQVVAAALGLPGSSALVEQGLGPQFFNPPTYTAADCPRYAGQSGPNCPPGTSAQTAHATSASGPFLTTPAEQAAAVTIATRLDQGKAPPSAALRHLPPARAAPARAGRLRVGQVSRQPVPWRTLSKLAVFLVVSVLATVIVAASLLNLSASARTPYTALFTDASGLQPGDFVDIAGVQVGAVTGVRLQGTRALVTFTADSNQRLTTTTHADVDYANLLGQQLLSLQPGGRPGRLLPPAAVIPTSRTAPALDLTSIFNGFQPLFEALSPTQVNQLTASIIDVFQGESGTVADLVTQTASLTQNLAARQQLIGQVIDNLSSSVAGTLDQHSARSSSTSSPSSTTW